MNKRQIQNLKIINVYKRAILRGGSFPLKQWGKDLNYDGIKSKRQGI